LLEPYGFFVATDEFNALRRKVTVALLAGLPGVVVCGTKGRGRTAAARAIAQLAFRDTAVHGNCVLRSLPRSSNERQSAQTFWDILNGVKGGIRSLSPSSTMVEQALLRSLAVRCKQHQVTRALLVIRCQADISIGSASALDHLIDAASHLGVVVQFVFVLSTTSATAHVASFRNQGWSDLLPLFERQIEYQAMSLSKLSGFLGSFDNKLRVSAEGPTYVQELLSDWSREGWRLKHSETILRVALSEHARKKGRDLATIKVPRLVEVLRAFFHLAHERQRSTPSEKLLTELWSEAINVCNPDLD